MNVTRIKLLFITLAIVCLVMPALTPVLASQPDYLSPQLRQQVEELKQAYESKPTDKENYPERAAIAWAWLNAYALKGGTLPVNITQSIRPKVLRNRNIKELDYYLDELKLLDEEPGAIGELTAEMGPFEARTYVTLQQNYHLGEKEVSTGGGFLIAKHWITDSSDFQVEDPSGDNYLSISSNNPNVNFAPDEVPLSGMHGGFPGKKPARVFRVTSGTLQHGDIVTVTYGDKSAGGRGYLMGTASTDLLPLPIWTS